MDLPSRFGKYELLDRIATGGMAEVFLARSFGAAGFEKRLVIKRILPDLAQSPKFVSMFIREAKISASLSHPNIVQVFDFGKVGPDHYIAMEHMFGRDLTRLNKALRASGRRMPLPLALYIVSSLLRGLGYAHARQAPDGSRLDLVHRDVSPHNVMVSFQGEVKLFDWGIARLIGQSGDQKAPGQPGGGKYAYMSPEQARGEPIDHRSDIYSAGIVLYELIVGHRLFQDPDPAEKLRRVQESVVPDPRLEVGELPDGLWEVLQQLLARSPDDRFPRAERAEEELRALQFRHGLHADAPAMGAFVRDAFRGDSDLDPGATDLEGLAADLTHLDGATAAGSHSTGTTAATSPPRGIVRMAPGERRPVVALVAETSGFTELSAKSDPEDLVRRHFEFLRRVRKVVDRFGGFVERFENDTCTVLFGVPRAGEHDLDRALACAQDLVRETRRFRLRGLSLDTAIGVHQGEILIGRQSGRRVRFMAAGDTLKLAQRLAAEADLGQVLVSDRIFELCRERWHLDRHSSLRPRRGEGMHAAYSLQGRRRRPPTAHGRWLRRSNELEVLRVAMQGLAEDRGTVLAIQGHTGTGKSRLLRELQALAEGRGVPMYVGRTQPFGERPLTALREVVAQALGFDPEGDATVVRAGLERLAVLPLDDAERGAIAALCGLTKSEPLASSRELLVRSVAHLMKELASDKAVILAFEDVDQLHAVEQQIVAELARHVAASPVLVLLTTRDRLPPPLGDLETIVLGSLARADQEALIADLVGVRRVSAELMDLVFRTAEGNPLYIEAVVKALQGEGGIILDGETARMVAPEREPGLPPGLDALIAARIDALDAASRGALQIAATIGSSFSKALLAESAGLDDPRPLVDNLVQHGLVASDGTREEGRYAFTSHLVLEVVRRSILGVQRRDFHRMVADGIERLFEDHLEPHRQALAEHCAYGGRFLDAARHASRAGDFLRRQQLLERAAEVWDRGIGWIRDAQDAGVDAQACTLGEALLRLKSGEVWALLGNPQRATGHLQLALDIAEEIKDAEIEARALLALGRLYMSAGKSSMARMHLEAAIQAAEDRPWGQEVAVQALEALGMLAYDAGDVHESDRHYEEALDWADADQALAARALLGLAGRHIRVGDELAAMELLLRAKAKAEEASDRILVGRIVNNIGIVHLQAGRYPEALEEFRQALEIREGLGYRLGVIINLHNIGDAYMRMGDEARAWASFDKSRTLANEANWERGVVMNEAFLAYLEGGRSGQTDDAATDRLRQALERAHALSDAETEVTAGWLLGLHLRNLGSESEAKEAFEQALVLARRIEDLAMIRIIEGSLAGARRPTRSEPDDTMRV
jgi:serine/threonine protein kinase/tetratricopeptide (TPR) repeat protein